MASTLKSQYQTRLNETNSQINDVYDKQTAAKTAALKTAYDTSASNLEAEKKSIVPTYQASANALAQNYEQNRRNANLNATMNGLNTGTQVQQENALSNNYLGNYATLQGQRANALTEADKALMDLKTTYDANVANATADIDATRASALMKNYNTQQAWLENQAATLAANGDFTGYKQLYGAEQATQMKNAWIARNPLLAYRMGRITAAEYKKMTGKSPVKG